MLHQPKNCSWPTFMFSVDGTLPGEVRKRHCPVIGSYSWFSSEHKHRKEPSTFSQRASPQTPLSISHSFTSGKMKHSIDSNISFHSKGFVVQATCVLILPNWKLRKCIYLRHLFITVHFAKTHKIDHKITRKCNNDYESFQAYPILFRVMKHGEDRLKDLQNIFSHIN